MLHIVTSPNQYTYIVDERTDGIYLLPTNHRWHIDSFEKPVILTVRDHLFPQWCEEIQTVVSLYVEICEIIGYRDNAELYLEGAAYGMRHCERDRGYPVAVWKTLAQV